MILINIALYLSLFISFIGLVACVNRLTDKMYNVLDKRLKNEHIILQTTKRAMSYLLNESSVNAEEAKRLKSFIMKLKVVMWIKFIFYATVTAVLVTHIAGIQF